MKTEVRKNPGDKTIWRYDDELIGHMEFSVDGGKTWYNLFRDYVWNMSPEEVMIFDAENKPWADFFADRRLERWGTK